MLGRGAVDPHPADRVDRGLRGRRLHREARLGGAPVLDDLGEDADGDLVRAHRADVEPGGRLEPREALEAHAGLAQALDDPGRPAAAGDQAHVAGVRREDLLQCVLVGVGVRGDDHRRVARDAGATELRRGLVGAEREDRVLGGAGERGQRLDHRPVTHENEHGVREIGLHVDLQRAAAVARHRVLDHARRAAGTAGAFADEPDQPRPAVGSAHAPPTQPETVPSARTSALAPGLAEVGGSHRTTVASANGSPRRWRSAARAISSFTRSRRSRGAASTPSPA